MHLVRLALGARGATYPVLLTEVARSLAKWSSRYAPAPPDETPPPLHPSGPTSPRPLPQASPLRAPLRPIPSRERWNDPARWDLLGALHARGPPVGRGISAQAAAPAEGGPAPAPASAEAAKRDEALSHFDLGLSHFDRAEWSAALAEFLQARDLYPTRAATKNAALCMRHEKRFDEALDMFEALDPRLPRSLRGGSRPRRGRDRRAETIVGTLGVTGAEPGASIVIDGKARGAFPLAAPLRVSVGSHVVRVFKEGFQPFERRIDIASGRTASIAAILAPLARSGRLRVVEQTGKVLDVVVDAVFVGKTPWEGERRPRYPQRAAARRRGVGTQPVVAPVTADVETPITLAAEELDASARIEPTPGGAIVAIDRVSVGRGVWDGRLRSGPHRIEVTAEGFVPSTLDVAIRPRERERFAVSLDRDPTSPPWGAAPERTSCSRSTARSPSPARSAGK